MGLFKSSSPDAHVKVIREKPHRSKKPKADVLLLGLDTSDRSTIFQRMRLHARAPHFSAEEIAEYRACVVSTIYNGLVALLRSSEFANKAMSNESVQMALRTLEHTGRPKHGDPFPMAYRDTLKRLWEDPSTKILLEDNIVVEGCHLDYFARHLDRLCESDYIPTEDDIIRSHVRPHAVTETLIPMRPERSFRLITVGNLGGERRKWLSYFEDVTVVVYVASLADYDRCIGGNNCLARSMADWDSVVRSRWTMYTSVLIVFNHYDEFAKKVQHTNIKDFFPEYDGPSGDAHTGLQYFTSRFMGLAQSMITRTVSARVTNAMTDTQLPRMLIAVIEDAMLMRKIENSGILNLLTCCFCTCL